jgi:hypothetical protein
VLTWPPPPRHTVGTEGLARPPRPRPSGGRLREKRPLTLLFSSAVDPARWHAYCSNSAFPDVRSHPKHPTRVRLAQAPHGAQRDRPVPGAGRLAGHLGPWPLLAQAARRLVVLEVRRPPVRRDQRHQPLQPAASSYSGLTVTNPTRWTEREFLKVRRLVVDLEPFTFFEGGSQVVNEVELDIAHLTIAGKADFLADNNAKDIFNGIKGAPVASAPQPAPGPSGAKQAFLIKRLRVRVDRITVISGDGTDARKVAYDQAFDFVFEANDITERNFAEKVSRPMGAQAMQTAARQQPELLLDLARERLRRSVTEKLLGEK